MKELEHIINEVGGQGKYQQRLLYFVLSPLFFFLPFSWMADVFFLQVPPHWCYHPMTNGLNETQLKAWKKCFLVENEDGSYNGCQLPLPNVTALELVWDNFTLPIDDIMDDKCPSLKWQNLIGYKNQTIIHSTCQRGWRFDQSEFTRTIPMDQEWVCDNEGYVADLYTYGRVGGILGAVFFSYIGDRFGRRLTFWITTAIICVLMTVKTFLSNYYSLYVVFKLVASACYVPTYQLPVTLITEISSPAYRTWAILMTWITW